MMVLMVAASPPDVATWLWGFAPVLATVAVMRSRTGAGSPGLWLADDVWPVPKMLSGGTGVTIGPLPPQQTQFVVYEPKLETTVFIISLENGLSLTFWVRVANSTQGIQ